MGVTGLYMQVGTSLYYSTTKSSPWQMSVREATFLLFHRQWGGVH